MAPVYLPSYYFPIYLLFLSLFILQSLLSNLYHKNTKNIYLIISIRSHFRKLPWRDWQPLYWLEVLVCLCGCVGLLRSLLLDWYLGSQKLREILTLLCCIIPSSLGKPTEAQEVARRISGAVAGESTQKVNIPSTHHNPYLSHYIICLSFSSPPLHPCRFIRPSSVRSYVCLCLLFACIFAC